MKTAKNGKVPRVQSEDRDDTGAMVGRGQKRIEQSLAAKPMLLQPFKEQFGSLPGGENPVDFAGRPPLLGHTESFIHGQWFSEASPVRGDMNELRENLGSERETISGSHQLRHPGAGRPAIGMLSQFGRDEKTRVDAVIHCRPSSISSKRSSSDEKGRRISPTLTGGISRTLCPKRPSTMAWRARAKRCCSIANSSAFSFGIAASISSSVLIHQYFATNLSERKARRRAPECIISSILTIPFPGNSVNLVIP